MDKPADFDLRDFMPYLLNQAAETAGRSFAVRYKAKYGMLRTEWRVVFHLGRYGPMTAKDICDRARVHKTKVSRAVRALECKRYLCRKEKLDDRRHETLALTAMGQKVFADLYQEAQRHEDAMMTGFTPAERDQLRQFLIKLAEL